MNKIMAVTRGINHIGLTVPDIEQATTFFQTALDGKIAYDSQKLTDEPRAGQFVERVLGIEKGAKIIKTYDGLWSRSLTLKCLNLKMHRKHRRLHYKIWVIRIFHFM